MTDLPQELVQHFLVATVPSRLPGYLLFTAEGQISHWGGHLDFYGLTGLSSESAGEIRIDFLAGLFPLHSAETLILPCLETARGVFADVHIFPTPVGHWVLLLDATEDERRHRLFQQQINGLSLRQTKQASGGDYTTITEILLLLDVLVLERSATTLFQVIGTPPQWFFCLYPQVAENCQRLCPGEHSAFLANFLIDAEGFWQSKAVGRLRSGPWSETDASGTEYHLEASAVYGNGRNVLVVERLHTLFGDTHAILQKARENNLDHQRLLQETQKKEILLHCIVHDLVQPLTGMKGCLALLNEEPLSSKGARLVELAVRQVRKQESMIQDILHVFAAEVAGINGLRDAATEAPDVGLCAQSLVDTFAPTFALAQVQVQCDSQVDWTADWRVVGERSRLERVLANLLENALRYSPRGSRVTVTVKDEGNTVLTTVEDNGPGIPVSLQKQLFQKFVRGKDRSGKSGLGLYFCRITIEGWGGTIGYNSRHTGGTSFWFRLPRPTTSD